MMAFGKEVVDGERPFMAKVSCPKLKERLCWQPSLLPVFSWAQTLPYSEEIPLPLPMVSFRFCARLPEVNIDEVYCMYYYECCFIIGEGPI